MSPSQSVVFLWKSGVYDPQRKMRITARAAFVKHQITLSSSALMKSDYPESPAARNNIRESGQGTCGGGEGSRKAHILSTDFIS